MGVLYAEAAYFDGNHCAHVAAWEDAKRLARIRAAGRAIVERRRALRTWP